MLPKLSRLRAQFVLSKIDEILAWERDSDRQRDTKFVELGCYLCEVGGGQYWRLENLKSFDEFLECRFPESRRKAYYIMSIHEHLPRQVRPELKQIGWAKAAELVKVARSLPQVELKHEVEKHLTGKEIEPYELVTFKPYKSQLPVVEQELETAGLMLGTDKSRGYCLEMICADFLAGTHADEASPTTLLISTLRLFRLLPDPKKQQFLEQLGVAA